MTVTCNDPRHEARRRMRCPNCGDESRTPCQRCVTYGAHGGACQHNPATRSYQDDLVRLRAELDRTYGTPCIICGAPVVNGYGHDDGCMGLDG